QQPAAVSVDSVSPPAMDAPIDLQERAESIVAAVGGEWGIAAWSIDGGRRLISIDAGRALIPASNNKVFTAAWVLDLLGPEHRFATDLLLAGEIRDGVLTGDVILRGSG